MAIDFSHPILTCAEAKAWEARLLKTPAEEWTAMQRAGVAVAAAIMDDFAEIGGFPADGCVLVLVGKGHNGGDALLAAAELLRRFPRATAEVAFLFPRKSLKPLAQKSWTALKKAGRARVSFFKRVAAARKSYALCLDGIFGFQFRPPIDPDTASLLTWINAHPRVQLRAAVDLPSGLGEVGVASAVFRADFTYATGIVKTPVLAPAAASPVGRVRYLDLGFFSERAPAAVQRVLSSEILTPLAGLRASQTDKRKFGHVFVVGGSLSYPGAVVLAVRAALRSGAGLVTAFVPASLVPTYAAANPEAMWVGCPVGKSGGLTAKLLPLLRTRIKRANALLVGPGLGAAPETLAMVKTLVAECPVPLVLDADALQADVIAAVRAKPFICTPHAGEFQRIEAALTGGHVGVVLQKGPITRVRAGEWVYHSFFGGPVLARGGSGDILAGLTAGLLAQTPADPALAACRGAVWHGLAADLLARARGQVAVEISQLLEQLGPALTSSHVRTFDRAPSLHGLK